MHSTACFLLLLFLLFLVNGSSGDRFPPSEQCGRDRGGALCPNNLCCSQYGYCGSTSPYCGEKCQSQCRGGGSRTGAGEGGIVSSIVTSGVFGQFLPRNRAPGCPSNGFYTHNAFIAAAGSFSGFGTTGGSVSRKRELAAFFANVAHETGRGCYVEEVNKTTNCDSSSVPACAHKQQYFGRGPLQLAWDYNYQAAGRAVGFDGINDPGRVSRDPTVSFKAALWYWMTQHNLTCHAAITGGQSFGATINAISGGLECGANTNQAPQQSRISLYRSFCSILNVDPGANLGC